MIEKLFLFTLSLLLTACIDQKTFLQKFIPKDDDVYARHFIEVVRTGYLASAQQMIDTRIKGKDAIKGLQELHEVLTRGEPVAFNAIGCEVSSSLGTRRTNLSYQIHFPDSWVVGNVTLEHRSDANYVIASHFQQVPDSLEVLNRFSLQGKSLIEYAVLGACLGFPVFIFYALVVCIRSRIQRKLLWCIFILFGVFQIRLNWTSGGFEVQPISVLLFGASVFRAGPYAAWVLGCAVPLGAIVFLARRRKLSLPDVTEGEIIQTDVANGS